MADDALLLEAERCRRLAGLAQDPTVAWTLEAVARECEARAFADRGPLEPLPAAAQTRPA